MSGRRKEPMRETLFVENITVPLNRARKVNEDAVTRLAESMAKLGLQTPITVRLDGDDLLLVAGLHRLAAALRLGWDRIDAIYLDGDATDARLWEIAENLHRADLSAVERNEHVAEWVKLTEVKVVSGQIAQKLPGRPEGGVSAAARDLGIERTEVRRAIKIAALPQETRDQAREENWSQNKLLQAGAPPKPVRLAPAPHNDLEATEAQVASLIAAWNRAGPEAREEFQRRIDQPLFEKTRAGACA